MWLIQLNSWPDFQLAQIKIDFIPLTGDYKCNAIDDIYVLHRYTLKTGAVLAVIGFWGMTNSPPRQGH